MRVSRQQAYVCCAYVNLCVFVTICVLVIHVVKQTLNIACNTSALKSLKSTRHVISILLSCVLNIS